MWHLTSLPNGETAPEGGITGIIDARDENGTPYNNTDDYNFMVFFHIPQGKSFTEYKLPVVANADGTGYVVGYQLFDERYGMRGFYSEDGTVPYANLATFVYANSGDVEGINLEIIPGMPVSNISGIVSLPEGDVAPAGGIEVCIFAENDNGTPGYYDDDITYNTAVTIPEGQSYAEYSIPIPVPTNTAITEYKVRYVVDVYSGYVECGYYNPEGTTFNIYLATSLDVSTGDKEGIDLELIPANFISGTISLPNGETAR